MPSETFFTDQPVQLNYYFTKTGDSVTVDYVLRRAQRARSWSRQQRPYVKTLEYSDVQYSFEPVAVSGRTYVNNVVGYRVSSGYPDQKFQTSSAFSLSQPKVGATVTDAKLKCLSKVPQSTFNAPLFAAEANKTLDLIVKSARTMYSAYKNVKKGRISAACRDLGITKPKGPSSNWLSYRYGWLPLISDVKDAAEAAAFHWYEGEPPTHVYTRLTSEGTRYLSGSQTTTRCVMYYAPVAGVQSSDYTAWRTECKAGLTLISKSTTYQTLHQFGLDDPLSLAWELVPFSFVADWFIGVGDYLASRSTLNGWEVLDGFTVEVRDVSGNIILTNSSFGAGGSSPYRYRYFSRKPWLGTPPAFPIVAVNLNPSRILDAVSLLRNIRS